jgi:membrane protease YdiL (CAAX protease family)
MGISAIKLRGRLLRAYLVAEFIALFTGLPLCFKYSQDKGHVIPVLIAAALVCTVLLLADSTFERKYFWNGAVAASEWRRILGLFAAGSVLLVSATRAVLPGLFLVLPRHMPGLWLVIMVLYPLVSVYPQEIIYRAFFFHRYREVFPTRKMRIAISALVFCLAHVVFDNPVALLLTLAGGWLLAVTYERSRSVAACFLEHSLYGCLIFTIGLGAFFFRGTTKLAMSVLLALGS